MIKIKSTDAYNQYDNQGREITTWDSKKCTWIINPEFENEKIDWWGQDNDFPRGCTLSEFVENNPNWDKNPNIIVTWTWNTKQSMMSGFSDSNSEWYNKQQFPYSESRDWGYLDYNKEETIEHLGKYCEFYKHADNTKIVYNTEVLFNGKLK